ncbi:MAG: N-acetyltransferase [Fimbriimonadales bacterium]|nr:N-acetyltransferase [Fimbriimonadales bacterium]
MEASDLPISNNSEKSRFELELLGKLAFLTYALNGKEITLVHTEVPEELQGHGLSNALAKFALDSAKASGFRVRIVCPVVGRFVRKHLEYAPLIAVESSAQQSDE